MASYAILTNGQRIIKSGGTHIKDWEYNTTSDNSTIILTKYIGSDPVVKVPSTMSGYNVALGGHTNSSSLYSGYPFKNIKHIESVIIEQGVDSPSDYKGYFENCSNLKTVDWPSLNRTYNFPYMFSNCYNLIRVNSPNWYCTNSRNTDWAFRYCRKLIESPVHFDADIYLNGDMDMFCGCRSLETIPVTPNNGKTTIRLSSGDNVNFYDCRKLKNIPIRGGEPGHDAFHNCHSLETQPDCYYNSGTMYNIFKNCYNLRGTIVMCNGGYMSSTQFNFENACANCYNITGVTFAEGANQITNLQYAFENCYNLTTVGAINKPASVINMTRTFSNCTKLNAVPWAWSNGCDYTRAFHNTGITTAFTSTPQNGSVYNYAFTNCKNLTNTGRINSYRYTDMIGIFQNCTNLTTAPYIANAYINDAFVGCTNLTTVGQLVNIHSARNAFKNCKNLTQVNTVQIVSYGNSAFEGCSNLRYINSVNIGEANNTFAECHNLKGINSAIYGNGFTNLFYNCQNLTSATFASTANTYYMNYAFYNCKKLATITVQNYYLNYMSHMCQGCSNLTSFIVNYSSTGTVNCINSEYAFAQCSNLQTINTTSSANTSNHLNFYFRNAFGMFQDCSKLATIPFNRSWYYNTYNAFENCANLKNVVINHQYFNIFANTFLDTKVTSIDGSASSGLYLQAVMSSAIPTLQKFNGYIQTQVANSFANCANLTTITNLKFSNGYGNFAFHNCKNLKTVSINTGTSLSYANAMFKNCANLTTVTGNIYVSSNAAQIFDGCIKLTGNIRFNSSDTSSFANAFNNTSLAKNVFLPFSKNSSTTVNSAAYNAAKSDNIGGKNGVTLYNIWNS